MATGLVSMSTKSCQKRPATPEASATVHPMHRIQHHTPMHHIQKHTTCITYNPSCWCRSSQSNNRRQGTILIGAWEKSDMYDAGALLPVHVQQYHTSCQSPGRMEPGAGSLHWWATGCLQPTPCCGSGQKRDGIRSKHSIAHSIMRSPHEPLAHWPSAEAGTCPQTCTVLSKYKTDTSIRSHQAC